MKKIWNGAIRKGNTTTVQHDKNKPTSKIFGASLCDICDRESDTVPFIVRDVCTFIENHHLNCEGIFRLSSSNSQTTKLREAFDQHVCSKGSSSVCSNIGVDGHAAANVLKQFFRHLAQPLIPDEVFKISRETKCVSDETFANSMKSCIATWPTPHRCTLRYLLSFLQLVMRNVENRMTVTGLAVVFGPNVFKISGGAEGLELQGLANQTFERLLLTADIICDNVIDDQGYLNMASPTSSSLKPARMAPPVPKRARPLPPPPLPIRTTDDFIIHTVTSSPIVPPRSISLERADLKVDDVDRKEGGEPGSFDSSSEEIMESQEVAPLANNPLVEATIRHVVRKHLFATESLDAGSSLDEPASTNDYGDAQGDDRDVTLTSLLPSLTSGRVAGPKNRRKPTRKRRKIDFTDETASAPEKIVESLEEVVPPLPLPRKNVQVVLDTSPPSPPPFASEAEQIDSIMAKGEPTPPPVAIAAIEKETPDSESLTKEEVFPQKRLENEENTEPISSPKSNVHENLEEEGLCDVVPPLDLSEVTHLDVITEPKPLPRATKTTPTKLKKRRKKSSRSSPSRNTSSPKPRSSPVDIPVLGTPEGSGGDDLFSERPTQDGSTKWRDAWSTDEEAAPVLAALEDVMRHDTRYPPALKEDNIEVAPSSPENHLPRLHLHHHPHHKHHHHHDNHLSRPKLNNASLKAIADEEFSDLLASLQLITGALDDNRRENGRPEDLTLMTREQIRSEKVAMQRELLKHEGRHGRPSNKQEKEIMRDIYERYRMVKRLLMDTLSPPFTTAHNRRFDDVQQDYDVNIVQQNDEFAVTQIVSLAPPDKKNHYPSHFSFEPNDHVSADLGIFELRKQEREAKGKRKRLRRKLRDFEREIEQQHGRTINQADRVVMTTEYAEYRDLKAKLRLLEALIEKHNSQQRSP